MECFIGLGANLENPEQQLIQALQSLASAADIELVAWSHLYGSAPMGPQDQPDYINAVACIQTDLLPESLLDVLQQQENEQGRVRKRRWGERTLDLDLLSYGSQLIQTERLTVPHPGIHDRPFVVVPWLELKPGITLPDGSLLSASPGNIPSEVRQLAYPQIDI